MDLYENKIVRKKLPVQEAELKIRNWCAYQERSQNETRFKLISFGLSTEEADGIISNLITQNFLNEERFAIALAGGKFRIKHWGKTKIRLELKKHKVSDYCINKALQSLDPDDYQKVMSRVVEKKLESLKTKDLRTSFFTVLKYAVSRGFEHDLVSDHLSLILKK